MAKKRTAGKEAGIVKTARKNFTEWDKSREDKTEIFKQCKSVKYWYVSDKGNVISFYNSVEPIYLKIQENKKGYRYVSGKGRTHYVHRLQAEAFPEVYAYGKAKGKKDLKGLEVHHVKGVEVNEPEWIEILDPKVHLLFKNVPDETADEKEHNEYMQKLVKVVEENTPNQTVLVLDGKGFMNGEAVEDLPQGIYADDVDGVKGLGEQAMELINKGLKEGKFKIEINPEYADYLKNKIED